MVMLTVIFWFIILLALLAWVLGLIWWYGWIFWSMATGGGPYVPSKNERVANMLALAGIKPTDRVVDLGSGDGRIVFAAAAAGAKEAVGYEIHPVLVWWSHFRCRRMPNGERCRFIRQSFWHADFHGFDVVFLYQLPKTMRRLTDKLRDQLPADVRVVSNAFELPGWRQVAEKDRIFLYQK